MAFGLDIYRYQTVTDWGAVKRHTITAEGKRHHISYIWRKLTDGGGRAVSPGDSQVRGAQSVGIPVGGYHYAQFSPTPERQAEVFVAECRRLGALDLVPMLDLEAPFSPDGRARDFGVRFCRRVKALGLRPGVYMSDSFARALRPDQWDTKPVIWIARYGAKPAYGGRYDIHQYSSSGRVAGITGNVDLNWAYTNAHFATGGGAAPGGGDDMFSDQDRAKLDHLIAVVATRYPRGAINGKTINGEWHGDTGEYVRVLRREVAALREGHGRLFDLLAQQAAVSAEDIAAALRTGLAAELLPVLQEVVTDALGEDNTETADRIADSVLDRLATRLQEGTTA